MLELQTFGGLELRTEAGERVEALTGRTKCLALLAYLAVETPDARVPREQVAALLWPDRTDDRARTSLRSALSHIRQATDPVLLAGKGTSTLGLARDHLRADATAFREALEADEPARALELYGGDFLAGVHVEGAKRFQRWADRKRGHLRQQAYEAALAVGSSAQEAGDLAAAEAAFRRALDLAPLREEAAAKLIRTLAARGRPADAVQLYEAFRERREAELEMAPSEELQQMVEELKRAPPAASGACAEKPAVEDAPSEPVDSSAEEGEGGPTPTSDGPSVRGASRWGRYRRRTLLTGMAAVGLLVALLAGAWHLLGVGGEAATAAAGDRSVAVLPFEAIGTENSGPIAEGLHSDLLTRLSTVGDLEVISATSVEGFRETDLPLPAIADSLGVKWVVEGEVQRAGDAIEVRAQLIDPSTDTHAWAKTYRRELTAARLFDLQAEISRSVAGALASRIPGGEEERLARRPTGSLAAHRFYVRGRSLMEQREPGTLERALAYFDQALAEDSAYALAWAGRANGLTHLARHGGFDPDTLLPRAREAADRALALQPDLAEAHAARGRLRMFAGDAPAALQAFGRAVALRPSYAAAHAWRAKLQLSIGRAGEGLASAERAVELDPLSRENQGTLVWALLANGRHERALAAARRATDLGRELLEDSSRPWGYEMLALSQLRRTEAMKELVRRSDIPPDEAPYVAITLASVGDPAPARRLMSRHAESEAPVLHALIHAALGDEDRALSLLRDVFPREDVPWDAWGSVHLRYFWPELLGPMRNEPGFEALMAETNRAWGLDPDGGLPETTRG